MALIQTLISGAGPLPLSTTFTAEADGDVVFLFPVRRGRQRQAARLKLFFIWTVRKSERYPPLPMSRPRIKPLCPPFFRLI